MIFRICRSVRLPSCAVRLAQLAPGGRLVYSTCSLEREENEDVVEASGAKVLETMQRIPGRDPGDGFFAAVLRPVSDN